MIHLLQSLADGSTQLVDVPIPVATGVSLVVESRASVVSAGTERMLVDFGRAGWLEKARRQPEKVRQVLDKVRTDGVAPTLGAVRAKLDTPIPIGYCQAGVVVETGPRVERFAPGDRVVTNGAHAEYVRVPHTLAAHIPDGVAFEAAAFTPLAAIGLQGLRLAVPTLGETVVVYGLGLIGLLTVQLARASGCEVIGIDRDMSRLSLAERFGARTIAALEGVDVGRAVLDLTGGDGADVVLLTLATDDDGPVQSAAAMSRKRGRIVLVGVTGLKLRRDDFYRKELSFQVSCSYGPGRYDPVHEEQGVDYPRAFVRWTEARNFEAVLALMADRRLDPMPLVTHRFEIAEAARAYDIVSGAEPSLGIVLRYPERAETQRTLGRSVVFRADEPAAAKAVVGWIGSGNFASRVLIPAFTSAGATMHTLASSGGVSAAVVGKREGFRRATTDPDTILTNELIDTVVVTTRHDTHASWARRALEAGKHVFVEKPLALDPEDIDRLEQTLGGSSALLCVGFNRRYAPMAVRAREALRARTGPLVVDILVNAGAIPRDHWTQRLDEGGGRIVGEAVHFLDLARYFVGAPIANLQVRTAGAERAIDDVASLQLGFADGSIASIRYVSNGHRGFPKERVELFADGVVIRIDNWRTMRGWGVAGLTTHLPHAQDKGHAALAAAFVRAVRGGGPPPIAPEELLEVGRWAILAGKLASQGGGVA
ncbi:MAG TPA: bi-domain-containing oxidoreductase [Gemmatimonadaceae bacterium]|nr:bi-domain-containing oxidoreductase [Gemmatimonadaceae bacterium]